MKYKTLAMFAILSLLTFGISQIGVYAEDEDEEDDKDRFGFGIQEREREHQDEDSSPYSGAILYVTIGAIVAAIAYTAFKIVRSKRAAKKLQ